MEETAKEVKPTKPTNCAKCNKPLKKKIWYYRNGKHYCTKTCWQAALKAAKKAKEEKPAAA